MDREIRRAVATRRETEQGNHPGFAAGTQGGRHPAPPYGAQDTRSSPFADRNLIPFGNRFTMTMPSDTICTAYPRLCT